MRSELKQLKDEYNALPRETLEDKEKVRMWLRTKKEMREEKAKVSSLLIQLFELTYSVFMGLALKVVDRISA